MNNRPTPDIESPAKPWQGKLSHSRGPSDDWGTIRDERQNAIIRVPITLDEEKLVEHRRSGTDPAQQIVDEILNKINSYEETKRERDEARERCSKLKKNMSYSSGATTLLSRFLKVLNERNGLIQKLDAWEEIAEHLHHLVQHPAYGVDQAIRRMDVLEAYKHLKK